MHGLIKDHEYIGVITKSPSNESDGKYLVYIRELMGAGDTHKPIWIRNEVLGNRFSRWLDFDTKTIKSSGSYFPLKEGMMVNVKFRSNTMESGYISNVISYLPLVDKSESRDTFYLLNKTINGSWIYQDDSRNLTHVMHNGGKSNIVLDDQSITLQTGGKLKTNGFEVSDTGTKMEFGNSAIYMDSTGIVFKVGDTVATLSETGIIVKSQGNIEVESNKSLRLKGKNLAMSSSEKLTLYSSVLRLTGAQQAALNSNVVNINSLLHTNIESQAQVNISGLMKTKIQSPLVDVLSLTNLNLSCPVITLSGQTTNISGSILNLSGGSIAMDGTITHGLGIAAATNNSMKSMNLSLGLSTDAANISLVTSMGNSDVASGIANATMIQSIAGTASPVGEILSPQIVPAKVGNSLKEKIQYITSSNESYNNVVDEQFKDLRNTHEICI